MKVLFVLLILINDSMIGDCEQHQLDLTNCNLEDNYTYALNNDCKFILEKHDDKTMESTTDIQVCDFTRIQGETNKFSLADQEIYRNKINGKYYIRYDPR